MIQLSLILAACACTFLGCIARLIYLTIRVNAGRKQALREGLSYQDAVEQCHVGFSFLGMYLLLIAMNLSLVGSLISIIALTGATNGSFMAHFAH